MAIEYDRNRHLPASHPVRRRMAAERVRLALLGGSLRIEIPADGVLPPLSATSIGHMSDRLAIVAEAILRLPDLPLTVGQQREAKVMAAELMRRATASER